MKPQIKGLEEKWNDRADHYDPDLGFWETERHLVKKYFGKKGTVLEIGCGAGRTLVPLAKMGFKVIGLDFSPEMLKRAGNKVKKFKLEGGVKLVEANAVKIPLPDKSVDYVFIPFNSLDCVFPVTERNKAITEISRVLKPGGLLLQSFHNIICIPGRFLFWYWLPKNVLSWLIDLGRNGGYIVNKGIPEFNTTVPAECKRFEAVGLEHLETVFHREFPRTWLKKFLMFFRRSQALVVMRKKGS